MITLPTFDDPDYTTQYVLEGVSYDFRIQYNSREKAFYADIGFTNDDPVLTGVKLVNGVDNLELYNYIEGVPPGALFLIDLVAFVGRPSRSEFGFEKRYRLFYLTSSEVENFNRGIAPTVA